MENLIEQNAEHIKPASNTKNVSPTRPSEASSARDRLLAALKSSPTLQPEDAERIDRAVRRAREESLIAELSA